MKRVENTLSLKDKLKACLTYKERQKEAFEMYKKDFSVDDLYSLIITLNNRKNTFYKVVIEYGKTLKGFDINYINNFLWNN